MTLIIPIFGIAIGWFVVDRLSKRGIDNRKLTGGIILAGVLCGLVLTLTLLNVISIGKIFQQIIPMEQSPTSTLMPHMVYDVYIMFSLLTLAIASVVSAIIINIKYRTSQSND